MQGSHSVRLPYRADIDGLRAFAVLCVVGYHAFPLTLKGGFVGVDIFFVISGYLISGIILNGLEAGTFSFWDFYARRIRRIFPALLIVLIAVLAFGWHALLPDEYKALGKHVLGGSTFISNVLLWQESGYFDAVAKAKPLLHLWSLGIEEQFYIIFPVLLWACHKNWLRTASIVAILCFLSFLDNIYLYRIDPTADFYSPLARVWELFIGAILCALIRSPGSILTGVCYRLDALCARILFVRPVENDGRSLRLLCAMTGVFLLGVALLLARDTNPWPAWKGLLPTLGTVFLIVAGPDTFINRTLFSNKIAVGIGLVSYPFYLWHWPLISFAYIINGGLPSDTRLLRVGLVLGAFILAVLTYGLVEKPIRFGKTAQQLKVWALIVCMVIVGSFGLYVWRNNGFPERLHIQAHVQTLKLLVLPPFTNKAGLVYTGFTENPSLFCLYSGTNFDETIALIGDSHAYSAYDGVQRIGALSGFNTLALAWGNWLFLTDKNSRTIILDFLIKMNNIKKVFIFTRGPVYFSLSERSITHDMLALLLQETVDNLTQHGKKVYLVAENPELPDLLRHYVARPLSPKKQQKTFPSVFKASVALRMNDYMNILYGIHNAKIIPTLDAFCPTDVCMVYNTHGLPMYVDFDHLSYAGSEFQAEQILKPYLVE